MAKYKVGDKVVLRKDLNTHDLYPMEGSEAIDDVVAPPMMDFIETASVVTIKEIVDGEYVFEEDPAKWGWTDGMIAGLYGETK